MKKWKTHGLRFAAFGIVAFAVLGLATMGLWNDLLPAIFGIRPITFLQALELLCLSRLLFGRFGGWNPGKRGRFAWKWEHLTPEEREKFRNAMGGDEAGAAPTAQAR